jgi:hypothetical protein
MELVVKKTTVQWNAHPHFKKCIEFHGANMECTERWTEALGWCFQTFGPSVDLYAWSTLMNCKDAKHLTGYYHNVENIDKILNKDWCFQVATSMNRNRFYFKDEKTTSMFVLKWK